MSLFIRDTSTRFVRGRVKLGTLSPGRHYWTWTGHENGGVPAADGRYHVFVEATFEDGYTGVRAAPTSSSTVATTPVR